MADHVPVHLRRDIHAESSVFVTIQTFCRWRIDCLHDHNRFIKSSDLQSGWRCWAMHWRR